MPREQVNTTIGSGNLQLSSGQTGVVSQQAQRFDPRDTSWGKLASALQAVNPVLEQYTAQKKEADDITGDAFGTNLLQQKEAMESLEFGNKALLEAVDNGDVAKASLPMAQRSYRMAYARRQASLYGQSLSGRISDATLSQSERMNQEAIIAEEYATYAETFASDPEAFAIFNEAKTQEDNRFRSLTTNTNLKNDEAEGEQDIATDLTTRLESSQSLNSVDAGDVGNQGLDAAAHLQQGFDDLSGTQLNKNKGPWFIDNVSTAQVLKFANDGEFDKAREALEMTSNLKVGNTTLGAGGKSAVALEKLESMLASKEVQAEKESRYIQSARDTERRNVVNNTTAGLLTGESQEDWRNASNEAIEAYADAQEGWTPLHKQDFLRSMQAGQKAYETRTTPGHANDIKEKITRGSYGDVDDIEQDPKLTLPEKQALVKHMELVKDGVRLIPSTIPNNFIARLGEYGDNFALEGFSLSKYNGPAADFWGDIKPSKQKEILNILKDRTATHLREMVVADRQETGDVNVTREKVNQFSQDYFNNEFKTEFDAISKEYATVDALEQRRWNIRREAINEVYNARKVNTLKSAVAPTTGFAPIGFADLADFSFDTSKAREKASAEDLKIIDAEREQALASYGKAKEVLGYTSKEVVGGVTAQGVKFIPSDIDYKVTPVFTSLEELEKEYKGASYERGGLFDVLGNKLDPNHTITHKEFYQAQRALLINK